MAYGDNYKEVEEAISRKALQEWLEGGVVPEFDESDDGGDDEDYE